jgi:hypothetical protein
MMEGESCRILHNDYKNIMHIIPSFTSLFAPVPKSITPMAKVRAAKQMLGRVESHGTASWNSSTKICKSYSLFTMGVLEGMPGISLLYLGTA